MKPKAARIAPTVLLIAVLAAGTALAADAAEEVTKVLNAQVAAWNSGSIERFMEGYENSDATVFTSGGRIVRGWKAMLERYRQSYGAGGLGVLRFSELQVTKISKDAALVLGRWQLQRAGEASGGVFTLLFRKGRSGWKIVHDHTSSGQ